jgi:hypothetical protein
MRPLWWAILVSVLLAAFFSILIAIELDITASGAGDNNPCSPTSSNGLISDQTVDTQTHYSYWRIDHGNIEGVPPQRECRLYGSVSLDDPYQLIDTQLYPSLDHYLNDFLLTVTPLFLVILWSGANRLRHSIGKDPPQP